MIQTMLPRPILFSTLTVALTFACGGSSASAELTRPNIVILVVDDLGYADLSCQPDHPTDVATPHIDRLALEGIRFEQFYVNSSCST